MYSFFCFNVKRKVVDTSLRGVCDIACRLGEIFSLSTLSKVGAGSCKWLDRMGIYVETLYVIARHEAIQMYIKIYNAWWFLHAMCMFPLLYSGEVFN